MSDALKPFVIRKVPTTEATQTVLVRAPEPPDLHLGLGSEVLVSPAVAPILGQECRFG
jgi:hypothetical protein